MITSVTRVWHGETWSDEKDGSREYEELYRIISDDPQESALAVRTAPGLPLPWASYPDDPAAICTGRSARRIDASRLVWEVTAKYEWSPADDEEENPLLKEPDFEWSSNLFTKPAIKDRNGEAIVNSAGDYYDPPPEVDVVRWNVNCQFNSEEVPAVIKQYAGAINVSAVIIDGDPVAAERARVVALSISKRQEENDVSFRTVTLAIEVRDDDDDPFDLEMLDQGYRIKDGTELKDILIEDEDGTRNRPSSPVLLDGNGQKLDDPSPSTAVFKTYEVPRRMDLTVFPGIV
jgi:hypothetical protein